MFKKNIANFIATLATRSFSFTERDIKTAIKHKDEMIPYFLAMIANLIEQKNISYSIESLSVIFLLSDLNVKQAFPLIIKLCEQRSAEDLETIFSVYLTEDLNKILADTYDGNFSLLSKLIKGGDYPEKARGEAVCAINLLYKRGLIDRVFLLAYYKNLFKHAEFTSNPFLMGLFICYLLDIEATELREEIESSFHKNLVDTDFISLEEAQRGLDVTHSQTSALLDYLVKNMPPLVPVRKK